MSEAPQPTRNPALAVFIAAVIAGLVILAGFTVSGESLTSASRTVSEVFSPPMRAVFAPANAALSALPDATGRFAAAALFIVSMLWVLSLRKEYANVDAPGKGFWYDLRFWTVVSMLPHVLIYLIF